MVCFLEVLSSVSVHLFNLIEQSVVPLGYELVDVELSGGMIRVFIDWPAEKQARITIEDCEQVSRQLSQVMMVEEVDYKRLEVSSPGVDRRLRRASDFQRFVGHRVSLRLRLPFGRRHWEGELARNEADDGWLLLLTESSPSGKAAQRLGSRKKLKPPKQQAGQPSKAIEAQDETTKALTVLNFSLDEIERAHLVPQLVF
jgi:ribosome maturation factor RimP